MSHEQVYIGYENCITRSRKRWKPVVQRISGVIRWLEESDYSIESISGCSIGALIGGVYAAGKLDEFEHWVRAITKIDIVALLDMSWKKSGLVKGDKIINTLIELVGDQLIETLPIRYTAIAADVKNEKEIWINWRAGLGCL